MRENETDKRNKWKERAKTIIIIILMIIIIILLLRQCEGDGSRTAVIDEVEQIELHDTSAGRVRVKMNPQVDIVNGTMQNLDFFNYNKDRLLQINIMVGEACVYESPLLKSGEILKGDYIDVDNLVSGKNDALAKVYFYDLQENLTGQTNVQFVLNYKK